MDPSPHEKHFAGNIELIEYLDHASAENITVRNYEEYYSKHTIKMRTIGLVFHEDKDKILVLHDITTLMSPRDAPMRDRVELSFHVIVRGTIVSRTMLNPDVEIEVGL